MNTARSSPAGEMLAFNNIYREVERYYESCALRAGVSSSAFCILYDMNELGDGCLQVDLCRTSLLSKQTVHSAVRRLEQDGILRLQPKGRGVQLFLTDEGHRVLEEKILPVLRAEHAAMAEMGPEQAEELVRLYRLYLTLLQKNMDKKEPTT